MKILLTGSTGYIGKRLLPLLAAKGYEIYALARNRSQIIIPEAFRSQVHVIEADLLTPSSLQAIPDDIDAAYYLVHSMSYSKKFLELETESARNFMARLEETKAKQIIYLSGLSNETHLSRHLTSRKKVADILRKGKTPFTVLMAGIIIGSGSASFEIIRDLVEKLPLMIAPKWLKHLTQPIAVRDVLSYLLLVLDHPACLNESFEIGGPDVLRYEDLLLGFAKARGLKRRIWTLPVLTPRLSSYWLFLITSTNFSLARLLVESLMNNVVCKEHRIQKIFPKALLTYEESIKLALCTLEQDWISPDWENIPDLYIHPPTFGVYSKLYSVIEKKKRKSWQLLLANEQRQILYSDQKWPGEIWLDYTNAGSSVRLTFRPLGLWGRCFWCCFSPFLGKKILDV